MGEPATVQHLNPEDLHRNPAFSTVVAVRGPATTVYVGGQNAVTASGEIVGKDDIGAQSDQVYRNLEIALAAAGAGLEHVVKNGTSTWSRANRCSPATRRSSAPGAAGPTRR